MQSILLSTLFYRNIRKTVSLQNRKVFLLRFFIILAIWNTFPIGVLTGDLNNTLEFNEIQLETIYQNKDSESVELGNRSFKEIIDEKFIEGSESGFSEFIWLLVKITGVFMWIGLMIIIFYHSYRILKIVFSKKD